MADAPSRPRVVLVNRCVILDDEHRILLLKRSATDRHLRGPWEIPGGKLDENQDLLAARTREIEEETGLQVADLHPLVYADSYLITDGSYKGLPYVLLVSVARASGGRLKLSFEHDEAKWAPYAEALAEPGLTREVRTALIALERYLT